MLDSNQKLGLFAARSSVPELEPLYLPQNWRADELKAPRERCPTCHWNGLWCYLTGFDGSRLEGLQNKIGQTYLEQSIASTNCFSCAVLLALSRKLSIIMDGFSDIWFSRHYGLMISNEKACGDIYVSLESEEALVPPGAKVHTHGCHEVTDPWSEETLEWADNHIKNCVQCHDCSSFRSRDQSLPTRLIYIPENANTKGIRLIRDTTTLPRNTRYASLTHCWGKEKPQCLTTVHNIDKYSTDGILWEGIPQTFKDGIEYTRRLGLEYIWIDSFCIIQNDLPDWENESIRMFSYYSNAYVTLGSTFSIDCTGGFFSERHIHASRLHLFDVFFRDTKLAIYASWSEYKEDSLNSREISNRLATSDSPYHLFKRAWTYQERLVSPRLLLFTENQLLFECYSGRQLQERDSGTLYTLKGLYKRLLTVKGYESKPGSWTELVGSFSVLQLSVATDKLPAFAAIAQQYLSRQILPCTTEDEYLCGLRKSHIHCDLLWRAVFSAVHDREIDDKLSCVGDSYLAPSWSWASIPRPTTYRDTVCVPAGVEFQKSTITFKGECLDFTKSGRFGRALGGYIIIEGPVLGCYMQIRPGRDLDCFYGHKLTLKNGWQLRFWPDFKRGHKHFRVKGSAGKEEVYLLLVWASESYAGILVLHENSENHRYYRLGVCYCGISGLGNYDWPYLHSQFKNAEQRILEIE